MTGDETEDSSGSQLRAELYFLIARFLSTGPCKKAAEVLKEELTENQLLPKRLDWEGNEHKRTFENLVEMHSHLSSNHLEKICERLGPFLDKEIKPSVPGLQSLLGAGRQSLLRTYHGVKHVCWKSRRYTALSHHRPFLPPNNFIHPSNFAEVSRCVEISGSSRHDLRLPTPFYSKLNRHSRKLGHLSAVYCVLYDRSGQHIFTGSDDHLVKIWSACDGRLLATLRGHSGEISDLCVNYENTILAAGSCDKLIRVWCLKTKSPIAVLHAHSGMITSLQPCPMVMKDKCYLVSTGYDGCVCFWQFNKITRQFNLKPVKFIERSRVGAQMLCSSFSPGGIFLATGSSDNVIRVYCFTSTLPEKVSELEAHTDRVDSIQYSHESDRFLTGSKDGTARIWRYERQQWRNIVLQMSLKMNEEISSPVDAKAVKLNVTMVCWNQDDSCVVTGVSDFTIKVWNSYTGKLLHILQGHEDEVFVLEPSPKDLRIVLSAGHDGHLIVWDIFQGIKIKSFYNLIEGQGHGAMFDCKISPDGLSFAATDSHGYLSLFGFGSNEKHKRIPDEGFFHTDYRPLIRDANNYVLDEQTQQAPHLMPPPFLVDIDGNPYPPELQKLVPGRENCFASQLVPQLAVNEDGGQEVIGEVPGQEARESVEEHQDIDLLIELMQRQQDERLAEERGEAVMGREELLASPPPMGSPRARLAASRGLAMRRSGEMEGVRQSLENVSERATQSQLAVIKHQVLVKQLQPSQARFSEDLRLAFTSQELKKFISERKKKPAHGDVDTSSAYASCHDYKTAAGPMVETGRNRLTTRALYDTEEEEEEESTVDEGWDSEKSGRSDSSEYSDWMGDQGSNLQPPIRTSNRQRKKKVLSTPSCSDETEKDETNTCSTENNSSPVKRPQRKKQQQKKRQIINNVNGIEEIPEEFRPPEWLTDTIPRKAPYVSQMGDEVIYFRQGHQLFLQAVKKRKIYDVYLNKNQPWNKFPTLREQELVRIVGIKYEIKPPRLCCLKLAFLNPDSGKASGDTFNIKYHDMPDVIDFLVLKQNYDTAMQRKWKAGDRFRSMIDDAWWMGRIESQEPFQEEYPDSMFQCFVVHWDNGEFERLSAWDMEPIDKDRLPSSIGGGVTVTQDELKSLMYTPKEWEWPDCRRDIECERIIHGIESIMEHSIAEPFLTPVDLNAFPVYGMVIEYPMDLSTIKARLENHFYRRVNALQFDVRYIESNAHAFNEPGSLITRSAKMLSHVILEYIKSHDCHDIMPLLTDLSKGEEFRWHRSQSDTESSNSSSKHNKKSVCRRKGRKSTDPESWREECKDLLETMLECQDSEPFRTHVNPIDYPDYEDIIDEPMDLGLLGSNLESDLYKDPLEFIKDTRLIFQNSRTYNTNKRSKIYIMTLRLCALFEEHIREILNKWRRSSKRGKLSKTTSSKSKISTSKSAVRKALVPFSSALSASELSGRRPRLSVQIHSGSTTELQSDTPVRKTSNPLLRKRSTTESTANVNEYTSQITNGHSQSYSTRLSTRTRKRKKLTSSSSGSSSSSSNTSSNSDTEIEGVSPKSKSLKRAMKGRLPPAKPTSSSSDEASDDSRTECEENKSDDDQEHLVRRSQRTQQNNETRKNSESNRGSAGKPPRAKRPHVLYSEDEESDQAEVEADIDNDDTDDEDFVLDQPKRRTVRESRTNNHNRRSNTKSSQQSRTRNRGQRTVHYEENSDDESSSSEFVTLSSRGRLRRLTPRARASLLGE